MQVTVPRLAGIAACIGLVATWGLLACSKPPPSDAAASNVAGLPVIMVPKGGHAIGGFDALSYFVDGEPRQGVPEFSHRWRDATWLFASSVHRDRFAADPSRYAPAYGGWCAYGVAEGYAAESDPLNAWTIHEGKLYLNWDVEVQREWRPEAGAHIERSEANWPELRRALRDGSATVYWHDE